MGSEMCIRDRVVMVTAAQAEGRTADGRTDIHTYIHTYIESSQVALNLISPVGIGAAVGIERVFRFGRARRAFFLSALSRIALVGYSVRCLRSWDLRLIICWARPRLKSRTSSQRTELQGSSLCAQREAGLVATCSSIRADPRLRPGRTGTEAEALRPACPIPQEGEKGATENASTS